MAPASLYHNMEYLWRLVRAFIYEDGRFLELVYTRLDIAIVKIT